MSARRSHDCCRRRCDGDELLRWWRQREVEEELAGVMVRRQEVKMEGDQDEREVFFGVEVEKMNSGGLELFGNFTTVFILKNRYGLIFLIDLVFNL